MRLTSFTHTFFTFSSLLQPTDAAFKQPELLSFLSHVHTASPLPWSLSLSHTHAFVFQPDRSRGAAELRAALRLLLSPSLISYSCPSPSLCSPFNLLFLPLLLALISVGAGFALT